MSLKLPQGESFSALMKRLGKGESVTAAPDAAGELVFRLIEAGFCLLGKNQREALLKREIEPEQLLFKLKQTQESALCGLVWQTASGEACTVQAWQPQTGAQVPDVNEDTAGGEKSRRQTDRSLYMDVNSTQIEEIVKQVLQGMKAPQQAAPAAAKAAGPCPKPAGWRCLPRWSIMTLKNIPFPNLGTTTF